MVDQLPKNINVTYSKSDDVGDSEVVSKVVESVLNEENDSTKMIIPNHKLNMRKVFIKII
ncbi:hypothetical protein Hanom_Chr08g00731001 [Helianthus anomalus]